MPPSVKSFTFFPEMNDTDLRSIGQSGDSNFFQIRYLATISFHILLSIHVTFWTSSNRSIIWSVILSICIAIFAGPLISILATEPSLYEFRETMIIFLIMISVSGPFYTVRDISYNALQTMRRNKLCVVIVFFQIVLKLSTMYIGGIVFGPMGLMAFSIISNCVGSAIAYAFARYYWNRFNVDDMEFTKVQLTIMDKLEEMRKRIGLKWESD